jgi:Spy/CpxP family protein refolding chaperone
MMGFGYAMQSALDLSDDQRKKLDVINDDLQTKTWDIMGKMRVEMSKMRELMVADPLDKAALDATYKRMNDLRQERFDAHLTAHEQMAAVLTKEQRQQLRHFGPWGLEPPG